MPISSAIRGFLGLLIMAWLAFLPLGRAWPQGDGIDRSRWSDRMLVHDRTQQGDAERRLRGAKAFPAYEAILADKRATALEVYMIFATLLDLKKTDRRRFVKYAVRGLKGHDAVARNSILGQHP